MKGMKEKTRKEGKKRKKDGEKERKKDIRMKKGGRKQGRNEELQKEARIDEKDKDEYEVIQKGEKDKEKKTKETPQTDVEK